VNFNCRNILRATALAVSLPLVCVAPATAQQPEPTYTIGSNELDILKFIQTVAAATGKTMVIDPAVKGKVKIMTNDNAMTADELYELFRSVLELSNFTVVEVGDVAKVIPIKDARTSPVSEASSRSGLNEIVTDVIPAENISAAKLLAALRPMVSTNANLSHHDGSNSIIITDNKANIDRIRRIIKKVDTAAVPTTEVLQLKYAEAEPVVQTLTQLDAKDKAAAGLSSKLQIVADKRNNAILLAGEDLQRDRIKGLIEMLDRPAQQTGNVRVVYLEYADATKVAETLTKVVQNIAKLSPGEAKTNQANAATVESDEDTNALLITAEGDTLNSLLSVVERLDIRRAQVLVEAIIVELNITDGNELGTEWLFLDENEGLVGSGPRGGSSSGSTGLAGALLGDETDIGTVGTALSGLSGNALGIVGGIDDSRKFLALLTALDQSSKANILSTPSLLTMDNSEAEISVGQEVPFATGSFTSNNGNVSNPFTTFQRESVGILLKVTPQINEGNRVLLNIEQEVSDVTETAINGGLITTENKIVTQVMAEDGEIVVLGGLMEESANETKNKVPVLGSIPLLGYFFKYQTTSIEKKNLMVFLRAKIVRDGEVMNAATAEKYSKMRDLQLQHREKGLPLANDKFVPVLPDVDFSDLQIESGDESGE